MHPIKKGHFSAHFIQYIPAPWLQACALEGRDTVKVGMVLWLLWSLKQNRSMGNSKTNNPNIVWANNWMFAQFHVAPRSASRALERLSKANLISFVKGGPGTVGQRPVVRLLFVKTVKPRIS